MKPMTGIRIRPKAFTLIELLVAMSVLAIIMLVLTAMISQTAKTWKYTSSKIEQFREARDAFESMARLISQATLNTYWDYDNPPSTNKAPTQYLRSSELRFMSGLSTDVFVDNGTSYLTGVTSNDNKVDISTNITRPTHAIFFKHRLDMFNLRVVTINTPINWRMH